jgi:hypothetical protein
MPVRLHPDKFGNSRQCIDLSTCSVLTHAATAQASRQADLFQADLYREMFVSSFRNWLDKDHRPRQDEFWKLFDKLQSSTVSFVDLAKTTQFEQQQEVDPTHLIQLSTGTGREHSLIDLSKSFVSNYSIVDGTIESASATADWVLYHQSFIVDGQHQLQTIFRRDFSRYLSAKATKRALEAALRELNAFDNGSISDLIRLVGSTLSREISSSIVLVVRIRTFLSVRLKGDQTTRDKVLNFSIHTGNPPPPTLSRSRSVVGRALVTLNTNARRILNGTLQFRRSSRNLRNAVYRRYSRPCHGRGTRNHAHFDRRTQPSGCRSSWVHRSLAKRA